MPSQDPSHSAAAIDLGSNSFHMVVASADSTGVQVQDRIKERIHLADGLDPRRRLAPEAVERALHCLERFRQRIDGIPNKRVRAVGTNTFRVTTQPKDFLGLAEQALGRRIEILSGEEEARLIYTGVRYDLGPRGHLLDIDIGGGSTEIVCGEEGSPPHLAESLSMGSSSWSRRHFEGGAISAKRFRRAILATRHELEPVRRSFRKHTDGLVVASSGTAMSMANLLQRSGFAEGGIPLKALHALREELLRFRNLDDLDLDGLKAGRRPTFLGGLAILIGSMEGLKIDRLQVSDAALREGLLQDLLGRDTPGDLRRRTVSGMAARHGVDVQQAERVIDTAGLLALEVKEAWRLGEQDLQLLRWAAEMHEIGLAVRHTGYHRHGAYLLRNSDLPGFSRTEAELLAFMVRNHRHGFRPEEVEDLPGNDRRRGLHLTLLLRLATQLQRTRGAQDLPLRTSVEGKELHLHFPEDWLEQHPLTGLDLHGEQEVWEAAGLTLVFA